MIGFSLHIGWIEDALFSFGYPYFGTSSSVAGALLFVWSTAVNRTVKIGWPVYEMLDPTRWWSCVDRSSGVPVVWFWPDAVVGLRPDSRPGQVKNW